MTAHIRDACSSSSCSPIATIRQTFCAAASRPSEARRSRWLARLAAVACAAFIAAAANCGDLEPSTCAAAESPDPAKFPSVPGLDDDLKLRSGLLRCRDKFLRDKTGLVAYVGGSITHNPGWTQKVDEELRRRFPETQFTFVHAGISSIDSTGHAFRLTKDVLERGLPDLIFLEAAVNDLHNDRTTIEQLRGMEGVVRRARRANPRVDIVLLHFAEPRHTADYAAGRTPSIIATHERVAEHYQLPSLDLAHEVQRRIAAGQFDWARDFKDLHPSPFGQELYFRSIVRLFDVAWKSPAQVGDSPRESKVEPAAPVKPLDPFAYDDGQFVSPSRAVEVDGFGWVRPWKPEVKVGTRAGFVDVPMFVGEKPGAKFSVRFDGRAIGLFLTAGPDAGIIEYRVDNGPWKRRDSFTRWSRGLHLPWALMLETELPSGPHLVDIRMAQEKNDAAVGTALRIRDILINGPAYDLPKLAPLSVKSSLDGTEQPSLLWAPETAKSQSTPLLVYLHSWSGDYRQDNAAWHHEAVKRGWIYLHPNFRGINKTPEACGSRSARQDILDAMDAVEAKYRVDSRRVYLAGSSGGGHMSLLMAAYFPERFSAVSSWVPITSLADWYEFHARDGKLDHYARMTIDSLGGAPGASPEVDGQYRERSPLFHLQRVGDLPIDINAGVTDGKTGSVPIFHSLRAFNVIAEAHGTKPITAEEMQQLWEQGRLKSPGPDDESDDPDLGRQKFLRRQSGAARVTIFDGGHEGLANAGCRWLATQSRATRP